MASKGVHTSPGPVNVTYRAQRICRCHQTHGPEMGADHESGHEGTLMEEGGTVRPM